MRNGHRCFLFAQSVQEMQKHFCHCATDSVPQGWSDRNLGAPAARPPGRTTRGEPGASGARPLAGCARPRAVAAGALRRGYRKCWLGPASMDMGGSPGATDPTAMMPD
jgi:hypothetical protein